MSKYKIDIENEDTDKTVETLYENIVNFPKVNISIVGLPGVGKTTLIDRLKTDTRFKEYQFVTEPVEEWIKSGLLDNYYDNPTKYAATFQTTALRAYFDTLPDALSVTERNAESNRIFARVLHDQGYISDKEWDEYESLYKKLTEEHPIDEIVVRLHLPLETVMERIKKRGRQAEKHITIDYLSNLTP